MDSLEQLRDSLRTQVRDEARFMMLNARLILRTGVNLTAIRTNQSRDRQVIARVITALREMGFVLPPSEVR